MSKATLESGKVRAAWPDVPYHFYVDIFGDIAEGRDVYMKGDTNTDYNPEGYIQIAVEGSFDIEKPSSAQLASVRALVHDLKGQFGFAPATVHFHNQLAHTICPGEHLVEALRDLVKTAG
jgi:hypothetical protein